MNNPFTLEYAYIVPAAERDAANAALEAAGLGPNNFAIALVPTSRGARTPPASHYAMNCAAMSETRRDGVARALAGIAGVTRYGPQAGKSAWDRLRETEDVMRVREEEA